ncbi:sterol desaturase family protein [Qipengyuania sp. CAU 1752]
MQYGLEMIGEWIVQSMALLIVACFLVAMLLEAILKGHDQEYPAGNGRLVANFGLIACTALFGLVIPFSSIIAAAWAMDAGYGLFNLVSFPWWAVFAAAVLVRTLTQYWYHRASHAWPLLWRIHRVHHSDTHVDLSLALREHPLDLVPRLAVFAGVTVLFGFPVWAVAIVDMLLVAAHYWQHIDGQMHPRLAKALGRFLATPEIHRIHHSAQHRQTNSNYGNLLIIWDRLFGSFVEPAEGEPRRIGLGELDDRLAGNLLAQLMLPLRNPGEHGADRTETMPEAN